MPTISSLRLLLNDRERAEEIARVGKKQYPQQCADHVISGEMTVRHVAHSRNKRGERSDDRHKTGENNRFAAMSLVKLMGLVEITATERFSNPGLLNSFVTKQPPDGVVDRITDNRGDQHQHHHHMDVEIVGFQ